MCYGYAFFNSFASTCRAFNVFSYIASHAKVTKMCVRVQRLIMCDLYGKNYYCRPEMVIYFFMEKKRSHLHKHIKIHLNGSYHFRSGSMHKTVFLALLILLSIYHE